MSLQDQELELFMEYWGTSVLSLPKIPPVNTGMDPFIGVILEGLYSGLVDGGHNSEERCWMSAQMAGWVHILKRFLVDRCPFYGATDAPVLY